MSYNIENLPEEARLALENQTPQARARRQGVGCAELREPLPNYNEAPCETVMSGKNNSYIVLGRDRPASRLSGYGGLGHTNSSMIDLVAGRMSSTPMERTDDGQAVYVDPNFTRDAARIYISQKTDIDNNLSIAEGSSGLSRGKSAVAIKADDIRLVARESMKLVTRTDTENSRGQNVAIVNGIDLIAGNDDTELQPIPKGENLQKALSDMARNIDELNGIVHNLLSIQMGFNEALTNHWHQSPFYGQPTSASPVVASEGARAQVSFLRDVQVSLMNHKTNIVNFKNTYLSQAGGKYINSRYNNVN